MVSLIERRREMMQMVSTPTPPPGPLYPVTDFSNYNSSGATWTVTRPQVVCSTDANSRVLYFGRNWHATTIASSRPTIFTVNTGDVRQILIKNISYSGSSNSSNYFKVSLNYTNDEGISATGNISFGSGSGTRADYTGPLVTQPEDCNVVAVKITVYRAVTQLNFEIYFYVNGIWYLI